MKLTLQLKLLPNNEQAAALLYTMRQFNAAASFAARQGFIAGVFSKLAIQKLAYRECRKQFGLSAQMAIRAIAKAAEAFNSTDKQTCPVFRVDGAMTYDERILSFKDCHLVSILAVNAGRLTIPYIFGEYQAANLIRIRGQSDLVYQNGQFFLFCTIEFKESPLVAVADFLGVDFGISRIATDSMGEFFSGESVDRNRRRKETARRQHQRTNSRRSKRKLKKMAGRQRRFQMAQNHRISKAIVLKAKTLGLGIALEDLSGIRSRVQDTVSRSFKRRLGNWGFCQLRGFIEYKARREGIPVITVNPRNTSRTCSMCWHCEKANRPSQSVFKCKQCSHSMNADENAARVIASLGRSSNHSPKVAALMSSMHTD